MIKTLKEAIEHAKFTAQKLKAEAKSWQACAIVLKGKAKSNECLECAADHEQLASWLEELDKRREADKWIPVSKRTPDDLEPVNITWINHEPEPYYKEIKDKPFTATGIYFNGQWYWWSTLCADILAEYGHNYDDIVDTAIEITHWKPLPKAPKSEPKECVGCRTPLCDGCKNERLRP